MALPNPVEEADALFKSGRMDEALKVIEAGLSDDFDEEELWLLKGHVLFQTNRYSEALEAYKMAQSLNPRNARAWLGKSRVYDKLGRFQEVGVPIPDSTTYVAVDFLKDDPVERLLEDGFQRGKRCLYILEGLLMYLDADSVDSTFGLMREMSGPGSRVVFDYIYSSVLRDERRYFGERELKKNVSNAGEPWTFGFEEGEVGGYLRERGFRVLEECDAEALERRFFTDGDGVLRGRINGTHSIVLAELV